MYSRLRDGHLPLAGQPPGFAGDICMPRQHTIRIDQCRTLKKLLKIRDPHSFQIQAAMKRSSRRVTLDKRAPFSLQSNLLRPLAGEVDRSVDGERST